MTRRRVVWILLGGVGLLALSALAAVVLLRRVIDPESFRGLLRAKLEQQLGRPVEFGEMDVSFWPLLGLRLDELVIGRAPSERFDEPLRADSLRVGARLLPLLRGRLEVTALTVEAPVLVLYRREDGVWEPSLPGSGGEAAVDDAAPPGLVIERLRVTRGRVVLRRQDPGGVRETTLDGLTLGLDGAGTAGPVRFELEAGVGDAGKLRVAGSLHPAAGSSRSPLRADARVELERLRPATLLEWLALLDPAGAWPADLLADRPISLGASLDYAGTRPSRLSVSGATLRGPALRLVRSASGAWNYAGLLGGSSGAAAAGDASEETAVELAGLTVEDAAVGIEDRSAAGGPVTLELTVSRLSLDRLPTAAPAALELDARVGAGQLAVRGTLGPLADDPARMPVDLSVKLEKIPLGQLRLLLPSLDNLDVTKATATASFALAGRFADRLKIGSSLSVAGAVASFATPQGGTRKLPLDLRLSGDLQLQDRAARIESDKLELELPGRGSPGKLTFRGFVAAGADPPRFDLELQPTRVAADDLAALAALLAPEAPLTFTSPEPVELRLRARGVLGGPDLPDLEGSAVLSDLTFRHAGMTQPVERVGAKLTFSPDRVALDDLSGVIGESDVTASRVVVTNFDAPQVTIDLNSRNADFWELFSFVRSEEAVTPAAPAGEDALARIAVTGKIRIERGAMRPLSFQQLASEMSLKDGVLALAPLEMSLYGGRFSGRLGHDLNGGTLTVAGEALEVEADDFLAAVLDMGGVLAGRLAAKLNVQVRASSAASVLAGVSGGGSLAIADGRLSKLDVLGSLSKVAGVFGERSLKRLTGELSRSETRFTRAETQLAFDSGTLSFDDTVVETAELVLAGRAALDLTTNKLQGRFTVAFSPELSATMVEEKSRAASLFWDPRSQRVSFGVGVKGLATAPELSVDWENALRGVAERKLGERVQQLLGSRPRSETPTPPQAGSVAAAAAAAATGGGDTPSGAGSPAAAGAEATPAGTPPAAPGLLAEITAARWTGPVLLRDLTLEGTVGGAGIDHASLAVVDAGGNEVRAIDRLPSVDQQLAGAGDAAAEMSLSWQAKIDGKRLALARFPVTVRLTVYDRGGNSASVTREVGR